MSNKKISGVPDIGEMIEFWDMKDEIFLELKLAYRVRVRHDVGDIGIDRVQDLLSKIESIGKKEKE